MNPRAGLLLALVLPLAACTGSLLESSADAPETYRLAGATLADRGGRQPVALAVSRPRAAPALDTERIAVVRSDSRFDYYAGVRWSEPAPQMLQQMLVRGLAADGRFEAVVAAPSRVPADLLLDTGHPAGLRMIERGGFGDPASPKRAVLIECGQHWEHPAADVAVDTLVRFLRATGAVDSAWAQARLRLPAPPEQRLVRVTEAVVARTTGFRFLVPPEGLGVVEKAGTPIAEDTDPATGEKIVWRAPCDRTVLVMPSLKHLRPGNTQVRLGRFV